MGADHLMPLIAAYAAMIAAIVAITLAAIAMRLGRRAMELASDAADAAAVAAKLAERALLKYGGRAVLVDELFDTVKKADHDPRLLIPYRPP